MAEPPDLLEQPDAPLEPKTTYLRGIADLHATHEGDVALADVLRGARVALIGARGRTTRSAGRAIRRAGGTLVAPADAPTVAVRYEAADQAAVDALPEGCFLLDTVDLDRVLDAYRRIYRPRVLREAIARAVASVGAHGGGRRERGASSRSKPAPTPPQPRRAAMHARADDDSRTRTKPRRLDIAAEELARELDLRGLR